MSSGAPGAGLAAMYAGLLAARNHAFDRGWLAVKWLAAPVISIGNVSVGGTGKTPAVIALGRALAESQPGGLRLDVLTRGYRRQGRRNLLILAPGEPEAGAEAGDEPRLLARALRLPVLVGASRAASGREGERRFGSQLHLLDDGFQRRQLGRCFDLVLVTPEDLEDRPLPAGRLREPLTALGRAQAILWVAPDMAALDRAAAQRALARWSGAPVYFGAKQAAGAFAGRGRPVFAFCALGRPDSFWRTLEAAGARVVGRRSFRDHHRYRQADLEQLRRQARAAGARGLVTTEKDAMNLPPGDPLQPLEVVGIEMRIERQQQLVRAMLAAAGLEAHSAVEKD